MTTPAIYRVTILGAVSTFDFPVEVACEDALPTTDIGGKLIDPTAYLGDGYMLAYSNFTDMWDYVSPPATLTGYTQSSTPYKTALGYYTQSSFWSSSYSTWVGYYAGYYNSSGSYSSGFGAYAGYYMYGTYNVCVGYRAGYTPSCSGNYNILIGANASVNASTTNTCIVIGNSETSKGSSTTVIGNTGFTDAWIRGNTVHFGSETATDKYWYFQKSASGVQPGFKWNNTAGEVQWSNDGTLWTSMGGGGSSLEGITDTGSPYRTALGYLAGAGSTSNGTYLGYRAGGGNTTSSANTMIGYYAGYGISTGVGEHVLLGSQAGRSLNSTAEHCVYIGSAAGYSAAGSLSSIGIGFFAAYYARGNYNVGVGAYSLYGSNTTPGTGSNNSAVGYYAGRNVMSGSDNSLFGFQAGLGVINNTDSTMIGSRAGEALGNWYNNNTLVGSHAGYQNSGGSANTFVGSYAGGNGTSGISDCTLVGYQAGYGLSSTRVGVQAFGVQAGRGFSGDYNNFFGYQAGFGTAVGGNAGNDQMYFGYRAGYRGLTGRGNIGIGTSALYGNATPGTGAYNVALGLESGYATSDGSYNFFGGYRAGYTVSTGSNLICIGNGADVGGVADVNEIVIGYGAAGKGSNTTVIGRQAATATTQTWLRGDELRVGNEGATDKYWYFQNSAAATQPGLKWNNTDGKIQASKNGTNYADIPDRIVYDLHKNLATDNTGVATVIGADYIDASRWPATRTVKFRCILETSNAVAGFEATADLFDTADSLAAGTPAVVTGSQVSTNALVASMVEATVTAAFAAFSGAGVFEARLWIATAGGGNTVTCKSAQLIVEW